MQPADPPCQREQETFSVFDQIHALCRGFASEWSSGARPDIAVYLQQVQGATRETLLRNLLDYELRKRREEGGQPRVDEYIARFPDYSVQVRGLFLETNISSRSGDTDPAATVDLPAVRRLGNYELVRLLGRGGMGCVFEALHVHHGNRVALKTLPQVSGDRLHQFKREFRSLADVNHPNLIGLQTLEADGEQWFFTMDLLGGTDFLSYVRPAGQLNEERLRDALAQLVTGVMALHANHIIHRDLKPPNVMVTRDGQVKLLDFGLVVELTHNAASMTANIAGTPKYMAPEQAIGDRVTAAADWYAVGVMLYQSLCGEPPFTGSLLQIIESKRTKDAPPEPLRGNSELPSDLVELALRMLARSPVERPDALEIAKAISAETTQPAAAARSSDRLIGRAQQIATLHDTWDKFQRERQPGTLFISGRSGEGKTTLAEHFLRPLRVNPDVVVLSGRCYDRESVPFKALDNLIDALCSYLRALPKDKAAILMPRDINFLAHMFPVLQRVEVVAEAPDARLAQLDDHQVRQRAFTALRELLLRISDRTPLVMFIDDLQWGDADSARVMFEVLRPPEPPAVLFIGTFRSDETDDSAFLNEWKTLQSTRDSTLLHRDVQVGPLNERDCAQLIKLQLGEEAVRSSPQLAAQLVQETGGNALLLVELIACFDPDFGSFRPVPIHELIDRKLQQLPAEADELLSVIAVSGQAMLLAEASQAAGHDAPAISTISHMRAERLVRLLGDDENPQVDTYHDRIRSTVLAELPGDHRRQLHLSLAQTILQDANEAESWFSRLEQGQEDTEVDAPAISRVFDLAYHFDAAGKKQEALVFGLLAGEQARRQYAPEVATKQYAIASRNAGASSDAVHFRIARGHGEALMLMGQYDAAANELSGVVDLTDDSVDKARIERLQGEIAFKKAELNESIAYFEHALRRLGQRVPKSRFGFALGAIGGTFIQAMHTLFPKRLHKQRSNRQHALICELTVGVGQPYFFTDMFKLAWSHFRGMNFAERFPPSRELAFQYAQHSMLVSMVLGWPARGSRYFEESARIQQEFNDAWGIGHSDSYWGVGLYAAARYEEAADHFSKAIESFTKTGDLWELNIARLHLGLSYYGVGDLAEAVKQARNTFDLSVRVGDSRTHCSSYLWARATNGVLPLEELKSCYVPVPEDIISTVNALKAEGLWHLAHTRNEEAVATLERAWGLAKKNALIMTHTVATLPVLVNALRLYAKEMEAVDRRKGQRIRKRALRLAKRTARFMWLFPTERPYALRELSLLLDDMGRTQQALRAADKSCAIAGGQGAKYEHARSALVRGELAAKLGLPEAQQQIDDAKAVIDAIEAPINEMTPL